jgi:phosphate transport system substrate-binding protein
MKKIIILALLLAGSLTWAQQKESGTVKLRGTRLTYPLVRKWISEFNKDYPNIKVSIAPTEPADSIDLILAAHSITPENLKGNREAVAITRYVQLPVANSKRTDLKTLQAKGFTEADFNNLYFSSGTPTLFAAVNSPITLYTRERPTCATITFARHFGNDPKTIKGVGVKGDDQDLATAVKEDVKAISFNNLGFIYDVKTRKVTEGLAVIPVDLNENGKVDQGEEIYGTLDNVIAFVEKTNHPKFVTENVHILYSKDSPGKAAGIFLSWVLTKGQKYNHELGFLNLEDKVLSQQRTIVGTTFNVSTPSCEGTEVLMKQRRSKQVNN